MRKSAPEPIGDVLKNVVEKLSQSKKQGIPEIISAWPATAGKEFTRHSKPVTLKKGTLLVLVEDSAWFYQGNLQKEKLLKALHQRIGKDIVQKISFRIGETR